MKSGRSRGARTGSEKEEQTGRSGNLKFPFSCPVCGRKTEYLCAELVEGAVLTCSFCRLSLTLHGHMLADVQREIQKLKTNITGKVP
jgi:transcription elongation factor Elf1